jgi:hypothetical protein
VKPPASSSKVNKEPAIAQWELWTVANLLISNHGDRAEAHAKAKFAEAQAEADEGGEIVWNGVITQLRRIRAGSS